MHGQLKLFVTCFCCIFFLYSRLGIMVREKKGGRGGRGKMHGQLSGRTTVETSGILFATRKWQLD